ncbi:MAG: alpha/beta hydrolase [Parcubacteria group bacterium]|jgi:pimeloyl-ACP methyl ester carboxylesterase
MFLTLKPSNLDEGMMARIQAIRGLLADTKTVSVKLHGKTYEVEYLIIPPMSEKGRSLISVFNYPGGLTHLGPCIEPFVYLDRESIHISPLGYGKSSDLPSSVWKTDPLHGAEVSLQALRALGKKQIILYAHSNGAPVVLEAALRAHELGIEVRGIDLINPLGLRRLPMIWAMFAHPVSGALSKIQSWFYRHPYDYLKDAYRKTKHPFSLRKLLYELDKSSKRRLPAQLQEIGRQEIPLRVVLSKGDWGSFHWPWTKSNEEIIRDNFPEKFLEILSLKGLHNVTLGKDSETLSIILGKSFLMSLSLAVLFFPYFPVLPACILGRIG